MSRKLTRPERKRVNDVLEKRLNYKELKTPEECHQLALHWDWDDGVEALQWIVRQPLCDQGTALYIYWAATPNWYYQFKDREDVVARNREAATYDLIKEIETRTLEGFYTRREIYFDPRNAECEGDDLTTSSHGKELLQQIPELLRQSSPGSHILRQNLVEILVRPLNEKEQLKLAHHLEKGYQELKKFDTTLTPESEPITIIEGIEKVVKNYRVTFPSGPISKRNRPLLNLGWVWAEQLKRSYNWDWLAWDYETDAQIGMFSPNQHYISFPPTLIRYTLEMKHHPNKIRTLFNQSAKINRIQDMAEAYKLGWIMDNPYFSL